MINAEQLIKRRVVALDRIDLTLDEELHRMDVLSKQRGKQLKSEHNRRKRYQRQYDPKFYDNDSEDYHSDEEKAAVEHKYDDSHSKKPPSKESKPKHSTFQFKKIDPSAHKHRAAHAHRASNLSSQLQRSGAGIARHASTRSPRIVASRSSSSAWDEPVQQDAFQREPIDPNADGFHSLILTIFFGEYLLNAAPLKVQITEPWTVSQVISAAISKWRVERGDAQPLKGHSARDYLMRQWDDDEMDTDIPAFGHHLFVHTLNERCVGLQFVGHSGHSHEKGSQSVTSPWDALQSSKQILVRVSIPGPNNESHVLAIDRDSTSLTLLDLISLLNKKKHAAHYNALYFDWYIEDKLRQGKLALSTVIVQLAEPRQLVLLPRLLTEKDNLEEAYLFSLVRLANERREYSCTKIRNARRNMKRLLVVDGREGLISKHAMDDYNIGTDNHQPIRIGLIVDVHVMDKNPKAFSIEYTQSQADRNARLQIYELQKGKDECQDFVVKVQYLMRLRRLLGLP